jgi:hypothetical protein
MRQASSLAAEISSARLGLTAIRKTALIAGVFVEDQGCLRKPLQSTGDKPGICGVAGFRKLQPETVDAVLKVVLNQGEAAREDLPIAFIGQQPPDELAGFEVAPLHRLFGGAL